MIQVILFGLNAYMTEVRIATKSSIFLLDDIDPFPVKVSGQGFSFGQINECFSTEH